MLTMVKAAALRFYLVAATVYRKSLLRRRMTVSTERAGTTSPVARMTRSRVGSRPSSLGGANTSSRLRMAAWAVGLALGEGRGEAVAVGRGVLVGRGVSVGLGVSVGRGVSE